jgi:hypothetical protein
MKPIYFPFTYIPESVGKAMAACFGQSAVYQIASTNVPDEMKGLAEDGILDLRIPVDSNGKLLDKILKDYRGWISSRQGIETAYLKTIADEIPFFDESASSQIRADLKKTGQQAPAAEKPDPLFQAILFLHMAQEFDLQNTGLDQDLMDIEAMEEDFMKNLKGEDDDDQARAIVRMVLEKDDPGHYMTIERLKAWALLMQQDTEVFGLFVTSSRAVVEHIIDIVPETEKVIRFDAVPMGVDDDAALVKWRNEFMESLETLATRPWPAAMDDMANPPEVPGKEKNVALTLYIVPGKTSHAFFADCVESDVFQAGSAKPDTRFKNILIGLVEKSA